MTDIAIRVENLSKQYRIGAQQQGRSRYKSLRDELTKAVGAPFRRAANLLRGQAYGAAEMDQTIWALKDVSFEACPELSRRVQRSEVVGIPSATLTATPATSTRSGAPPRVLAVEYSRWQDRHWAQRGGEEYAYFGRLSTRLKVLCRITEPTEGQAELHGRVGSLLEAWPERSRRVGAGFHPTPPCPPASRGKGRAGEHITLNGAIPSTGSPPRLPRVLAVEYSRWYSRWQGRPGDEAGGD